MHCRHQFYFYSVGPENRKKLRFIFSMFDVKWRQALLIQKCGIKIEDVHDMMITHQLWTLTLTSRNLVQLFSYYDYIHHNSKKNLKIAPCRRLFLVVVVNVHCCHFSKSRKYINRVVVLWVYLKRKKWTFILFKFMILKIHKSTFIAFLIACSCKNKLEQDNAHC